MEVDLFEPMSSHKLNHCVVNEYKLDKKIANNMLNECKKFKHDYEMGGRKIIQFGNDYLYSGLNHVGREHTEFTKGVIELCNSRFKTDFNSILMNVYPAGKMVGIGKHSDSEEGLEYDPMVLSISLGSPDFFHIISNQPYADYYDEVADELTLTTEHGSVIMMGRGCQMYYQHHIKPSVRQEDRISLTLRKFV